MNNHRHKRKRLPNFSNAEKELLLELALKYKDILENKKTDAGSCKDKENAWKAVAVQFNVSSTVPRDWINLKHAYENMKHAMKKKVFAAKTQPGGRTGGGAASDPEIHSSDDKVLSLLVNTVLPLRNNFDSDAIYQDSLRAGSPANDDIHNGNQDSGSTVYDLDLNVEDADSGEASCSGNALSQIPTSIQNPPFGHKFGSKGVAKWTNRRRPPTPPATRAPQESLELAADYANLKKVYYDELIKGLKADESRKEADERRKEAEESRRIAEEERKKEAHEATMALLKAQARYYSSLSCKITEEN